MQVIPLFSTSSSNSCDVAIVDVKVRRRAISPTTTSQWRAIAAKYVSPGSGLQYFMPYTASDLLWNNFRA